MNAYLFREGLCLYGYLVSTPFLFLATSLCFKFLWIIPEHGHEIIFDSASNGSPRETGKRARVSTVEYGAWAP